MVDEVDGAVPLRCPECGSARVQEIVYGLLDGPTEGMLAGREVPGGCCIVPDAPRWRCADCAGDEPEPPRRPEELRGRPMGPWMSQRWVNEELARRAFGNDPPNGRDT